jgi:hypothetical protein
MKSLVPGQFTTATVRAGGGELEAQLSQGGNWQIKVRLANEPEWRLLCVGHLDGRVLAPATPAEPEANVRSARCWSTSAVAASRSRAQSKV